MYVMGEQFMSITGKFTCNIKGSVSIHVHVLLKTTHVLQVTVLIDSPEQTDKFVATGC